VLVVLEVAVVPQNVLKDLSLLEGEHIHLEVLLEGNRELVHRVLAGLVGERRPWVGGHKLLVEVRRVQSLVQHTKGVHRRWEVLKAPLGTLEVGCKLVELEEQDKTVGWE